MWRSFFRKLNINGEITGHNLNIVLFHIKMFFFSIFMDPLEKYVFPKLILFNYHTPKQSNQVLATNSICL